MSRAEATWEARRKLAAGFPAAEDALTKFHFIPVRPMQAQTQIQSKYKYISEWSGSPDTKETINLLSFKYKRSTKHPDTSWQFVWDVIHITKNAAEGKESKQKW